MCKKHQARDENIIKSKVKLVKDTIKPTGVLERERAAISSKERMKKKVIDQEVKSSKQKKRSCEANGCIDAEAIP